MTSSNQIRPSNRAQVKGIIIHFVPLFVAIILITIGSVHFLPDHIKVSTEDYYTGVVTLATGAMVAIFLAVFYADVERIEYIREKPGALTLFFTILIDLLMIVLAGLLIDANRTANILVLVVLTIFLFDLIGLIMRMVFIALKPSS